MNDYSSLDELFYIYIEPATEGLEMMAATTVARVGGAGIAHVVHTIDADKAGQLTNDELRELKEAAKWCRSKFKSMAPDIVKDRLNKGIVKLGKNDKILKSNIANFDFNASISDDKMRDEHWAPVVTATSDITNVSGGLTNYGYDFYKLIKGELEKKYPNCEMDSMEVGKYIYVLKYKKSKAAKESVAMEGLFDKAIDRIFSTKEERQQKRKDENLSKLEDAEKALYEKDLCEGIKPIYPKIMSMVHRVVSKYKSKLPKDYEFDYADNLSFDGKLPIVNNITWYSKYREDVLGHYTISIVAWYASGDQRDDEYFDTFYKLSEPIEDEILEELYKIQKSNSGKSIKMDVDTLDSYESRRITVDFHIKGAKAISDAKESAAGGDETMNDLFEGLFEMSDDNHVDPAFESIATNLRRDYQEDPEEPISLKSMYCVHMNDDALKKYQDEYDQLKKVDKNAEKLRGCMYFWQKELAAFISIDIRSDKVWIDTLEVVKKFRGKKLSFQLLDVAVRKFHATDLKVHIDNKKAIGIFKTYGFKTYDKKNNWLYMTLRDDVKDIDEKHTEDVKPVDKGTMTDNIQEAKEAAAMEGATARKVARVMHHGLPGDQAVAYIIDAVDAKQNRNGIINTAKRLGEITDSSDMAIFKDVGNKCIAAVSDADKRTIDGLVKNLEKKRKLYTAAQFERLQSTFRSSLQSVNLVVKSVDISYAKKYRVIPIISTNNVKLSMVENTPRFKPLREALSEALSSLDIQNEYQIDLVDMGFDGYLYGIQFIGKRDRKSSSAKESIANESAVFNKSKDSTEVEKLLAHTEPTLRRQLTTVEDCDKYLEVIKNESTKFNEAANAIISAYSKYESGDKTKEDTKEFNKTVAAGKKLLNDNCRKLNVRLGKLVGDNDHISRQDVKNFAQYVSGLRKIVNSIKRDLIKSK